MTVTPKLYLNFSWWIVTLSFLISNNVIITSILLFKIINMLNHLTILSNKFLFQRNALRFLAILGKDMGSAIKQHGVIMMHISSLCQSVCDNYTV